MVLKLGRFGQQIRNTWKDLKCGAGEGWRRSGGPIMWEMKKCYLQSISRGISKGKANWIGHILRRNCILKQVIEGDIKWEIEVIRRRGRRRKKLLDYLKNRRGYSYLKEEALDCTVWRNRFGGSLEPVVRHITEWMNVLPNSCSAFCLDSSGLACVLSIVILRVFTRIFFRTRFTVLSNFILNLCAIKQPVAFLENRCGERKLNETGAGSCLEFLCSTFDVECSPSVTREQRKITPLQDMAAYGGVVP